MYMYLENVVRCSKWNAANSANALFHLWCMYVDSC